MNVERFRTLIASHLGLAFEDARLAQLAELATKRVRELGVGEDAYLERVARGERDELAVLAEALTVGETYFFRNREQLAAFTQVALPDRMRANAGTRQLRILSAACSTGEEPYTLAILARETIAEPGWTVGIRGVDVNPASLRRAALGRYTAWALRETSPERRRRWFVGAGRDMVIDESIRKQVRFDRKNLIVEDAELWHPASYDIVFCRNVLMYFGAETAKAVIARIERALVPGGYLFLGHAETLRGVSAAFDLCHTHETFYYQLATGKPRVETSWPDAIARATERVRVLEEVRAPVPVEPPVVPHADRWREALALFEREELDAAVQCLAGSRAHDAQLLRAVVQLQRGHLDEVDTLLADAPDAPSHYVLALADEVRGDLDGAVVHHTAATHLDPTFAMPHLQLGLLSRRAGDRIAARRALGQALALLEGEPAERVVLFGGGFRKDALIALCRGELARVEAA
jgi:chemotaxis protein methyltransferase CheR